MSPDQKALALPRAAHYPSRCCCLWSEPGLLQAGDWRRGGTAAPMGSPPVPRLLGAGGGRCGLAGHCPESGIDRSCAEAAAGAGCLPGLLVGVAQKVQLASVSTCVREDGTTHGKLTLGTIRGLAQHCQVLQGGRQWPMTQTLPSRS